MAYVALKRFRFGNGFIEAGEPVPIEEGRNYDVMERAGQIARVTVPQPTASVPTPITVKNDSGYPVKGLVVDDCLVVIVVDDEAVAKINADLAVANDEAKEAATEAAEDSKASQPPEEQHPKATIKHKGFGKWSVLVGDEERFKDLTKEQAQEQADVLNRAG